MKSIYHQDDLRCTEVGRDLEYEAQLFFERMMEKYPEHNPREMAELCNSKFSLMANRKILDWRREGVKECLKKLVVEQ